MKNVSQTYLLEYAKSPTLIGLIELFNASLDGTMFEELFLKNIVNPLTANQYGLEIWSRIVSITDRANVVEDRNLGFDELLEGIDTLPDNISNDIKNSVGNFAPGGEFPMYDDGQNVESSIILSGDDLRSLIMAKAASNITEATCSSMNDYLMRLCGNSKEGKYIWVEDGGDMTTTVCYNFYLSPVLKGILFLSGVIAKPTGVEIKYKEVSGLPNGTATA